MDFKIERDVFPKAKEVKWDDVIVKIEREFADQTHKLITPPGYAPTFVLHQLFLPGSLQVSYEEVKKAEGITNMHTYLSFGRSQSFGNHADTMDVLIVQAIGRVGYVINNCDEHWLDPGDAIWIPQGVWHNPIITQPRVTLSFSWD